MSGSITWFARNPVAANLLMVFLAMGGVLAALNIPYEVFPEVTLDRIQVEVAYLGAAPEEVEEAVCVRIEEAIQGIDGIKQVTSTASEGMGTVVVELTLDADARRVLDDIKNRVDAIDTFPGETEKPIISELIARQQVIDLALSGNADEFALKATADRIRNELSSLPAISLVEVTGARPYEISVEVSESALRRHGLTLDDIADAVRRESLDLPGGAVRGAGGDILLRTIGQAYRGAEYEDLVLLTRTDGTRLRLGQVATVVDGFAETDQSSRFDADPTVLISVFRTGDQSVLEIAASVHEYVERTRPTLPEGISLAVWRDEGKGIEAQLSTLFRNGMSGFVLVFLVLTLFLELRLALWVSLGIPISFLGAVMLMPGLDVTVNSMTVFALVLVLGVVVDDAIIVGEHVHAYQERDGDGLRGAIEGGREVATPVVFAVLTTVAAFVPLMFVPGWVGKMFRVIPMVVVPCLLFSLIESLWILPAHLARIPMRRRSGPLRRFQQLFANSLKLLVRTVYQPMLELALRWRYLTAAIGVSTLVLTGGIVLGGWLTFHYIPPVESDQVVASITMPQGISVSETAHAVRKLELGAARLRQELLDDTGRDYFRHTFTSIGDQPMMSRGGGQMSRTEDLSAAHLGEVTIELVPSQERELSSEWLSNRWRELTGSIPEAVDVSFNTSIFALLDEDVDVMLVGSDLERLRAAASEVKAELGSYAGVYGVADSFRAGKREMKLGIKPAAQTLGLTLEDLGRQVRQAFYGEEAQRIQRGRDDVRVMVRYPPDQRRSVGDLENMRIRTQNRGEVPFELVATVEPGRGFASIKRVDRHRVVNVTASVDETVTSSGVVLADLQNRVLPAVLPRYPGVYYLFEGALAEQEEAIGALRTGFLVALMSIFALLAVPLRSYLQPLIIMSAIPFGLVGAVWGHIVMGLDMTFMSMLGLVALAGVVVNDNLVMVTFINRRRALYADPVAAIREAGVVRFRPILLTSLTTFFGLAPLMLERSIDAVVLQPMAVALAFGVVFATSVTLFLVPAAYLILEDLRRIGRGVRHLFALERADPFAGSS